MSSTLSPIGIDVSKLTLDIRLLRGEKLCKQHVANTPEGFEQFQQWLMRQGVKQAHVCVEATGTYSDAIARYCYEQGHQVSVINPAWLAAFRVSEGKHSKTDGQDAVLLARYCQQKRPLLWQPTPDEVQEMQGLVQRLDDLEQARQQERNRLENSRWTPRLREQIEENIRRFDEQMEQVKAWIAEELDKEQSRQMQQIVTHLESIIGIGRLSAVRVVSTLVDLTRFASVEQVVAYVGVAPCERQSGTSVHGAASISKTGRAQLRKWLYMCAIVSKRWDADMRRWAEELEARGKTKKQVLVAVMRKLLHIIYGCGNHSADYDPRLAFPSHYASEHQGVEQAA